MKKFLIIATALLAAVAGCTDDYDLNTNFTTPTELVSPSSVILDVTSSSTVELSWSGGGAADGGFLLYSVLFDTADGDFSDPIQEMESDYGAYTTLTLTHAQLNTIARRAGIETNSTGSIIWTVTASRGGEVKMSDQVGTITVTRGAGIDNIPDQLFILGDAAAEAGQEFRCEEEGLFVIYTRVTAGSIYFNSAQNGTGYSYSADADAKLAESSTAYTLAEVPASGIARITVNFNTLSLTVEEISYTIEAVLDYTQFDDGCMAELDYAGSGVWSGEGDVELETASWGTEERYCFRVYVDGEMMRWGSDNDGTLPDGTEEFWYVYESEWSQWSHLWKLSHDLDQQTVVFTVNTNDNGVWNHSTEVSTTVPSAPTSTPDALYITGGASEEDNMAFRKEGDQFVLYTRLTAGTIKLVDGSGGKYYLDANKNLYVGGKSYTTEASEGVSRITVDFSTNTATFDDISTSVYAVNAWDKFNIATLTYQGLGKWAGEDEIQFAANGDERFSFKVTVNGTDVRWGSNKGNDGTAPDGTDEFWYIYESEWDDWNNLYKFNQEDEGKTATFVIDGNNAVHMTHSITVSSGEPETPSVAPESLSLNGTAAESAGQTFRKESDGVFVIYSKLGSGTLTFNSDSKNYFATNGALLQGEGEIETTGSTDGCVTRITVNFVNATVTYEEIGTSVYVENAWDQIVMATLSYQSLGVWSGSGAVQFAANGDERYSFRVAVDGTDMRWGSNKGNDGTAPDGTDEFWYIYESEWEGYQWNNLYKFNQSDVGKTATFTIYGNDATHMYFSIVL